MNTLEPLTQSQEHQIHTAHLRLIVARSELLHSGYSEDIIREAIRRLRDE